MRLMKSWLIVVLVVFSISGIISAIKITEVEMNPVEGTYGKEWIEFYNNESSTIDISGWKIYDEQNHTKIIPNGTIIEKDNYYVFEIAPNHHILNNEEGDSVTIYNSLDNKIDKTPHKENNDKDSQTWQLCDNEWIFAEQTKGIENNCPEDEIPAQTPQENSSNDSESNFEDDDSTQNNEIIENSENYTNNQTAENPSDEVSNYKPLSTKINNNKKSVSETSSQNLAPIKLTSAPKDIKSEENKSSYPIYSLIIFCILLGILFIFKKKKSEKTEFET